MVLCNANSYCLHLHPPPFSIKTNFRENRFLRQGGRLVDGKGSFCVKIHTENMTKV